MNHNPSSRNQAIESYGEDRPWRGDCECQYDHGGERGWCPRRGGMHNGMAMCGPCWRGVHHRKATFDGKDPLVEYVR